MWTFTEGTENPFKKGSPEHTLWESAKYIDKRERELKKKLDEVTKQYNDTVSEKKEFVEALEKLRPPQPEGVYVIIATSPEDGANNFLKVSNRPYSPGTQYSGVFLDNMEKYRIIMVQNVITLLGVKIRGYIYTGDAIDSEHFRQCHDFIKSRDIG